VTSTTDNQHWAGGFFTELYSRVYQGPLDQPDQTEAEVEFLLETFEGCTRPLLDIGCGFGRHLRPLRKAGLDVVGLDRFTHLLANHPKRGRRLVAADMRALPFADRTFGGAWCMFNTFGYFGDEANKAMLAEWARVLQPGAALVLNIPNRSGMIKVVKDFPPTQMMTEGFTVVETYEYDADEKCLVGRGIWQMAEESQNWEFRLRMYTASEIERALVKAGFDPESIAEDFDGNEFDTRSSAGMVLTARRGG